MAGPFYAAVLTYVMMLLAFYWHRLRRVHMAVMVAVMLFDLGMPFYLVSTRDWGKRLITDGDILSFGVWMHFGLLITLFVLYAIQVQTAVQMLKAGAGDGAELRQAHRAQGKGILVARALVIATGAMLAEPIDPQ
jgi:hypothetical protein